MAKVTFTQGAREDLRDLSGPARYSVLSALQRLALAPERLGQPLGGRATADSVTFRKFIAGIHRIVYRIETGGTVVVLWVIGNCGNDQCYQRALSRIRPHPGNRELVGELVGLLGQARARREDGQTFISGTADQR